MDDNIQKCGSRQVAAGLLALGVFLGGFFPGYFYYRAKMDSNFVTVKGLSEMDVRADLAVWELKFVVTGNDLKTAQNEFPVGDDFGFFEKHGFSAKRNYHRADRNQ